jgi:hypothetical protein
MDDRNQQGAAPVIKTMIPSKSGVQNTGTGNDIQWKLARREYVSRKDQGWALLDGGSTPLLSDKGDSVVTDAAAMAVGEDKGTYKAPSK